MDKRMYNVGDLIRKRANWDDTPIGLVVKLLPRSDKRSDSLFWYLIRWTQTIDGKVVESALPENAIRLVSKGG